MEVGYVFIVKWTISRFIFIKTIFEEKKMTELHTMAKQSLNLIRDIFKK